MESCEQELNVEDSHPINKKGQWIFLIRQLYVCSGVWMLYFVLGLCFGAPTVFIPQIRREANSSDAISLEMETWLTSVHGYSSIPFVIIIPIVTQRVGRKIPFIIVCINTIVCFIVFYWSNNTMQLLLCEIQQGMLLASNITLFIVIVTEYTSPRYRGVFMSIEATIFFCGVWVANATGTFAHWKNIGLIAFVCCAYSLSAFFWPESPSWLAMKGKFDECTKTHYWLKGYDASSVKELSNLISSQREYIEQSERQKPKCFKDRLKIIVHLCKARAFYKPLLLCISIMSLYHFSGKMVCTMYAVELIRRITNDEFTGYIGMLILEGVTIVGMQIGCVLSKYLTRRTLLLLFSAIGIIFLFIISLYLYLIHLGLFSENKYLSISLLMAFSITISIGPIVVSCPLFGELVFLRYKSISLLLLTLYSELLMATVLKISPHIFQTLTLHGAFFFYGIFASIFAVVLFKYLPETKDKTLYEIEGYFVDRPKTRESTRKLISRT